MSGILVLAEIKDHQLRNVAFETLTAAKRISRGGQVAACMMGSGVEQLSTELKSFGADKIYVIENEQLNRYQPDAYKLALLKVIDEVKPEVLLTGHTSVGKDLFPRIAARLNAGLISDCTDISDNGTIVFTRPIYAGKAFEKKKFTDGLVMATIRPNNILPQQNEGAGEIIKLPFDFPNLMATVRNIVKKTAGGMDLSEAKVIVSGGRGVKSEEGFHPLLELAQVLNGAVGASRGACDANYCDYSMQIGQTGKVVNPDLYIACGISGAIQHLAGMSNSKVIVAINKDPEAPIFKVADYGIVGDLFEVVPLLTEEFRKLLNE